MSFEVDCDSCGARFALPDDLYERKVKGRIVTIKCKKCGEGIKVDGTRLDEAARPPDVEAKPTEQKSEAGFTPTVPLAKPSDVRLPGRNDLETTPTVPVGSEGSKWLVSFSEDDDRELTNDEIAQCLVRGEIDAQTIVWRDGMDDWLPMNKVPDLAGAIDHAKQRSWGQGSSATIGFLGTGLGVDEAKPAADASPTEEPPPSSEEAPISLVPESIPPSEAQKLKGPTAVALSPGTLGSPKAPKPPPRREGAPKAEAKPEKAEERKFPKPPSPPKKEAPPEPVATAEEPAPSSVPDLRSLKKQRDTKKSGDRVDEDIFGLGGSAGIVGAPDPTAPMGPPTIDISDIGADAAPPSSKQKKKKKKRKPEAAADADTSSEPGPAPEQRESATPTETASDRATEEKKGSPLVWVLVGAAAIVAGFFLFARKSEPTAEPTATTAEPAKTTEAPTSEPVATVEPPKPEEPETPEGETETDPPNEPGPKPAAGETAPGPSEGPSTKPTEPTEPAKPSTTEPPKETPPAEPTKPKETEKPKEVPVAGEFDASAARSALAAAAGAASGCRSPDDPSGSARVTVTFAPSGRATNALVNGPPFAGTKTGGCIARAMRSAQVPPFSGSPVTVGKTVVIR